MKQKRTSYSSEFKVEAIKLGEKLGFSKAGQELGVHESSIRKWRKSAGANNLESKNSQIEKPSYSDLERENRRLKRELGYMETINEVLKKSTAIFSQEKMGDWK